MNEVFKIKFQKTYLLAILYIFFSFCSYNSKSKIENISISDIKLFQNIDSLLCYYSNIPNSKYSNLYFDSNAVIKLAPNILRYVKYNNIHNVLNCWGNINTEINYKTNIYYLDVGLRQDSSLIHFQFTNKDCDTCQTTGLDFIYFFELKGNNLVISNFSAEKLWADYNADVNGPIHPNNNL